MNPIKKITFSEVFDDQTRALLIFEFTTSIDQMEPGTKLKVTIEIEDDTSKYQKRYFAMVTELGKYAGYSSHKEREVFKEQVRTQLKIDSMTTVKTAEDWQAAIEGVHQLAGEHYHYTFLQDGPIIKINNGKSDKEHKLP